MKFAILVSAGPYQQQGGDSALQFARAVLRQGHSLTRVFFYHDGVNTATRLATPPQDDRDLTLAWRELAVAHGVDLVVCVAAAQRRGIVDANERQRHGKDADNLAEGFRIAGLGLLIEAAVDADRLVQFG
jgi:tRNA 2-thiouridine synthesizing protein D